MPPQPPPAPSHQPRVFVLADSISLHYGPFLEKFLQPKWIYERKQGRTHGIDLGTGANGGDSVAVLEYLQRRREGGGIAADWLLFNCGLHDLKRDLTTGAAQVELHRYGENLRAIHTVIREMPLRPVWVRTTPVLESLHNAVPRRKEFDRFMADVYAYNTAADLIMSAAGVPTVDLFSFTVTRLPGATYDGVHFNDETQQLQAAFLAGALETFAAGADYGVFNAEPKP